MKSLRIELKPGTPGYEALIELSRTERFKGSALSHVVAIALTNYKQINGASHHDTRTKTTE